MSKHIHAKRVFCIVADGCGAGAAPDAAAFGDEGAHTLKSAYLLGHAHIPHLLSMGLGQVEGQDFLPQVTPMGGCVARLREKSGGKDTTVGHWELMGLVSTKPLPTYPAGFPAELLEQLSAKVGRGILCNKPYSGTQVICDYGQEHLRSGALIVYTSADSVFQIAAHEGVVPPEELYRICRQARALLVGEHGVGRVIARPFAGEEGAFYRTAGRRDFSLLPPKDTLLDRLKAAGQDVIAVGKIEDIFAGQGITRSIHTSSNQEGMAATLALQGQDFCGLAFVNLVDFDMVYGHRRDVAGYGAALSALDAFLGEFLSGMRADDVLIVTADHGTDPAFTGTDHTREYVPCLIYQRGMPFRQLGTVDGFDLVAKTIGAFLGTAAP